MSHPIPHENIFKHVRLPSAICERYGHDRGDFRDKGLCFEVMNVMRESLSSNLSLGAARCASTGYSSEFVGHSVLVAGHNAVVIRFDLL
jgi:hypothetical protein